MCFSMCSAREASDVTESQTYNCVSGRKISGFWLSNENIVTRLISSVVPEVQKSKCVNSALKGDSRLAVSLCVSSSGFGGGCFHIEATLTSASSVDSHPTESQWISGSIDDFHSFSWQFSWLGAWTAESRKPVEKEKKKAGGVKGRLLNG